MTDKLLKDAPKNIGDLYGDPDTGRIFTWNGSEWIPVENEFQKALRERDALRAENARLQQLNCELIRKDELEIIEALRAANAQLKWDYEIKELESKHLRNALKETLVVINNEFGKEATELLRAARAAMGETK